jgi:hypothetical protein
LGEFPTSSVCQYHNIPLSISFVKPFLDFKSRKFQMNLFATCLSLARLSSVAPRHTLRVFRVVCSVALVWNPVAFHKLSSCLVSHHHNVPFTGVRLKGLAVFLLSVVGLPVQKRPDVVIEAVVEASEQVVQVVIVGKHSEVVHLNSFLSTHQHFVRRHYLAEQRRVFF